MTDKTIVKVVELGDALDELQPTVKDIKALIAKLAPPNDFLIYPVLLANHVYDQTDGDMKEAQEYFTRVGELVIWAYMALRMQKRAETTETKGMH